MDIGREVKEVEFAPVEHPVPVHEPELPNVPEPVQPTPVEEPVHAGVLR